MQHVQQTSQVSISLFSSLLYTNTNWWGRNHWINQCCCWRGLVSASGVTGVTIFTTGENIFRWNNYVAVTSSVTTEGLVIVFSWSINSNNSAVATEKNESHHYWKESSLLSKREKSLPKEPASLACFIFFLFNSYGRGSWRGSCAVRA